MRFALLALAVALAVVLVRRRRAGAARVVVAWRDGAEVGLGEGTPEHERIAAVAGRTLR